MIAGENLTPKLFLILGTATWFGSAAWSYLADSIRIRTKNIYPITIFYSGKGYSFYGFYDSGNLLIDSVSGKPVSVGTTEILSEICSEETVNCLKHLKENPEELKEAETVGLSPHFFSQYRQGTWDDAGCHIGKALYSDSDGSYLCGQTSICVFI